VFPINGSLLNVIYRASADEPFYPCMNTTSYGGGQQQVPHCLWILIVQNGRNAACYAGGFFAIEFLIGKR